VRPSAVRAIFAAPWLAMLLLAVPPSLAAQQFDRHRLPVQTELSHVYTFDLTGNGAQELLVVEVDRSLRDSTPRLRVFHYRGGAFEENQRAELELPAKLAMLGVGRFPGGPALVLLMPHRLALWPWRDGRFHPDDASESELESIFLKSGGEPKSGLQWVVDLNGDGFDEIVVPLLDGLQVMRVGPGGSITPHVRLATRTHTRLWFYLRENFMAYELPIVRFLQVDGRGWQDVVAYAKGLVQIFYLDDSPAAGARAPDEEFDLQPPKPLDPKLPRDPPLKLVKAQDLNGDGLLDMVFAKVASTDSSLKSNTRVLVYYGRPKEGGSGFTLSAKPDQVFASEGFTYPILVDINSDGGTDLALVNVEIGFWTMLRALIARTVNAETAFYLMSPQGRYPKGPNEVVGYSVKFSLGRFSHQPLTSFGDFNGDERPDLLLSVDKNGLGIHWGQAGAVWDDDHDFLIEDFLPIRANGMRVTDIDGDGRDDLIFSYNRNDIRQMPEVNRKITVLLSRFPKQKAAGSPINGIETSN
jgi:hypothetical protein